jgi:hypothetical protein
LGIKGWFAEDLLTRKGHLIVQVRASGQVKGDVDECIVEGNPVGREPSDPGFVAEGLRKRCTNGDPDILDGVVCIDLEVAATVDDQAEATMPP